MAHWHCRYRAAGVSLQGLRARIEAENVPFTRTASSNLGQRSRMLRTGVHFKRHVRTVDSRPGSRSLNGERCDAHQLVACSILRNAGALRAYNTTPNSSCCKQGTSGRDLAQRKPWCGLVSMPAASYFIFGTPLGGKSGHEVFWRNSKKSIST